MKKFKLIVPSFLTLIFCLLLIAGSTFAIFSSQAEASIEVTSGKVHVTASLTGLQAYSAEADDTVTNTSDNWAGEVTSGLGAGKYKYVEATPVENSETPKFEFATKGTAELTNDKTLILNNIVPGDKVTLKLNLKNSSNVDVKYRVRLNATEDNGLLDGLKVKVNGTELVGTIKNTAWLPLAANGKISDMLLEVLLPITAGNEYQEKTAKLRFTVEMVQANAKVDEVLDLVNAYLTSLGNTNKTMWDAIQDAKAWLALLENAGKSFTATNYVWNMDTDQFYAEDNVVTGQGFEGRFFKAYTQEEFEALETQTFSIYAVGEWSGSVDVIVGFDAGDTTGISSVSYVRTCANDKAQEIVIRTNSASTNIVLNPYVDSTDSTKGDHIEFYGSVGQVTGPKDEDGNYTGFTVAFNSFKINGKVVGLKAASGHIDLTNAEVEEDEEIIILATTTDVKVSNPNKVSTHAHATSESNANAMNDPVDSTKKSVGVTWDYDGNVAQNAIDDIHHHIALSEEEITSARENGTLGTGPVDGGEEWKYENTVKDVIYSVSNEEVAKNASYVARIGGKGYETLAAAVTDAKDGDTIVMLKDDTLTATVIVSKIVTIDLNGKTVGRLNITSAIGVNCGNLTINDSAGTGKILGNGQALYTNAAGDVLTVNGGTIQGSTYGIRLVKADIVTINGCTIIGGSGGYGILNAASRILNITDSVISGAYAINTKSANTSITISDAILTGSSYGINNSAAATITISDSTISAAASNSYAVYNTASNSIITIEDSNISGGNRGIGQTKTDSTITLQGGNISGGTYGVVSNGTLTVNDGTIQANSYYAVSNSGTLTMNGGTIIGGTHESYGRGIYNNGTAIINGGTISLNAQSASQQVAIDNRKTLTINGGNITSNVIGVYTTDSLNMTGGSVTGGTQAIQTLGTTSITGGEVHCDNGTGINAAGGSVTINKVRIVGDIGIYGQNTCTITINGDDVFVEAVKPVHLNSATSSCNISAGTFNSGSGEVCYAQNGIFTISGGTFTGSGSSNVEDHIYRYTLNCLDSSFSANPATAGFTVTGGSFYQFNPENDLSEGANTRFTAEDYHTEYNEETGYYTVVADE